MEKNVKSAIIINKDCLLYADIAESAREWYYYLHMLNYMLLAFFCLSGSLRSDTLTSEMFTETVKKALLQKKNGLTVLVPDELHLKANLGGAGYHTFLDDAYREYRSDTTKIDKIVSHQVAAACAAFAAGITLSIDRIVPMIVNVDRLNDSMKNPSVCKGDSSTHRFLYYAYNKQLAVVYGHDEKGEVRFFCPEEFERLHCSRADLPEIARNTMTTLIPAVKVLDNYGMYMVSAGGRYEASLILQKSFWTKERFPVNGDIVVAVPSRDLLMVTGSNNRAALNKMAAMAREVVRKSSWPIVADLFVMKDGTFEKYAAREKARTTRTRARSTGLEE